MLKLVLKRFYLLSPIFARFTRQETFKRKARAKYTLLFQYHSAFSVKAKEMSGEDYADILSFRLIHGQGSPTPYQKEILAQMGYAGAVTYLGVRSFFWNDPEKNKPNEPL